MNPELAYGALQKPEKGAARAERVARRKKLESREAANKSLVRKRDRRCRWPHCDCHTRRDRLEVAHIIDKSLGGSSEPENLLVLCLAKHQGRESLHSGDLRVETLTAQGANGALAFWRRDVAGQFYMAYRERAPFILERD